MKIGIYGGTFDPIHYAHLILAREAREKLGLDKVIFVPAAVSPFKRPPMASPEIRLAMLRTAIEGEMGFTVDECELHRPPPSYTIDTIEDIQQREAGAEIHLLIGDDKVSELPKWQCFADLEKMVRFVVLSRTAAHAPHSYSAILRRIDISATEIRKRVATGRSIRYLVPEAVEAIIRRENLYRERAT